MHIFFRSLYFILMGLALPGMVLSASELTFDGSGRPEKLVLGDKDFHESDSSEGFVLRHSKDGEETEIPLSKIIVSRNRFRVAAPEGKPNFTFQIDAYPHHLALHLLDVQGIGTGLDYSLSLQLESEEIAAYRLNDLMTARGAVRRNKNTELTWPTLWARPRGDGSRGSVVLYDNRLTGSELDAVLAEIWSAQAAAGHMVKPTVQSWTETDVLVWVDRWVDKFRTIAVVSVDPDKSEADLYELTDKYVIPNRVRALSGTTQKIPHCKSTTYSKKRIKSWKKS
ncbi:hypothetical protein P4C99_10845 [Pontiellaceae bacterium B1224]|nr:hypothetical protein [Pontiellaceae bacterium B1224]